MGGKKNYLKDFIGKEVEIISTHKTAYFSGYLVCMDERFLYLGETKKKHLAAIAIDHIIGIRIVSEGEPKSDNEFYRELLEKIPNDVGEDEIQ